MTRLPRHLCAAGMNAPLLGGYARFSQLSGRPRPRQAWHYPGDDLIDANYDNGCSLSLRSHNRRPYAVWRLFRSARWTSPQVPRARLRACLLQLLRDTGRVQQPTR